MSVLRFRGVRLPVWNTLTSPMGLLVVHMILIGNGGLGASLCSCEPFIRVAVVMVTLQSNSNASTVILEL